MMNHVNSILIEGCLTGDPVSRSDPEGEPVCTFAMASNHLYKSEGGLARDVCFLGVEARGRLAEGLRDLGQGRGVRAVGRLRRDRRSGSDGEARDEVFSSPLIMLNAGRSWKGGAPPDSGRRRGG
jgi:single-strand DNA-binding protein